ncbi:MAG: histone deacetylase [Syntrophomonadaceae bacterium]|nr:histone deacetylase [Syntrophomonadaceae bacterium]
MKKTGVVFFPAFDWAISPSHPEREERLLYTRDQLFEEGIMDLPEIIELKPRMAQEKDIARVHFCVPDVRAQATDAHLISAGAALTIADGVMSGELKNGFSIARPPGHHAMTVAHGNRGFCNINNEAIMVEYIRSRYGVKKIAVVDTDVHHGDGSQEIFYDDPDVLFISFHQDGRTLYPGSGFMNELGGPSAYGTTINIPLAPNTTDEGIHFVLDNLVLPILEEFEPELVINSAGQDNHYTDPLANMRFSAQGYALLNRKLAPDIAVLEGGYSVETALPYVNMGILMAMAGIDYSNLREPDYDPSKFKETERSMLYLRQMVDTQLFNFRNRDACVKSNYLQQGPFFTESRRVYYDTDGIDESQHFTLRMCPQCKGYSMIRSQAWYRFGDMKSIAGIRIPRECCEDCRKNALKLYRQAQSDRELDFVYLQDRDRDRYYHFDCTKREEREI